MKNFKKLLTCGAAMIMSVLMVMSFVGCNSQSSKTDPGNTDVIDTPPDSDKDPVTPGGDTDTSVNEATTSTVSISSITAESTTISKSAGTKLTVSVEGSASDKSYKWSVSDSDLVKVENDTVTVIGDTTVDKYVTITATANADSSVTKSVTLLVKAPVVEGQVGELTTGMISQLGNSSITVTGTLVDYYQDFNQSANSSVSKYDMTVKMEDGKWSGSWNIQGNTYNTITDIYRRGEQDGVTDQQGNSGHTIEKVYIDKNNQVAFAAQKDYMSVPAVWEAQHLYNHLGNLSINKFEYDATNKVYAYKIDENSSDDLYLMTYLSYSLTPMLEDTLMELYLVVENGAITKLLGQTEVLYYGSDTSEDADGMSYTTIELSFSNIGTTTVEYPTAYEAPEYADKLTAALSNMGSATNYTYKAVDTQTYAPSTDDDDYSIDSSSSSSTLKTMSLKVTSVANNTSSQGTVGNVGYVTKDAVLFADTIKYSYTLDGKAYRTEYTGYKQFDGYYEEFEYSASQSALVGTKHVTGSMFDAMPTFDFSANVFEFSSMKRNSTTGKYQYTFVLRDTAITRDLAMEVSAYKYASSATASVSTTMTIVVDEDGNIVSTVYPYSLVSGTYMGYVTTTYSNIGTTALDEDTFTGYVPRQIKNSWSDYTTKYYSSTHSTLDSHDEDTATVINAIFGDAQVDLPAPSVLMEIFGDNINGPFYDWKEKTKDEEGNVTSYIDYFSITTTSTQYDENMKITNYEEIMSEIDTALKAAGFTLSIANTDTTGGSTGLSTKYACYIKNDVQIVIENNNTRYFWIYFYKTGDWKLNK
jgi:hypothetical protein